jgi:hypothetical protein
MEIPVKVKKILAMLAGGIISLVLAILLLPGQIVDFQKNLPQALIYASSILYGTQSWDGKFDKFPEGLADIQSLGISTKVDAALELEVVDINRLDGRVWWRGSCASGSPYSGLLLDGRIRLGGSSAKVIIWELVSGQRVDLASGSLATDGLTIQFAGFPENLGLNGSVIAKNPEPALLEDWQNLYCD